MKRKRLTPKKYRHSWPVKAQQVFTAIDPAIADDILVLHTYRRDLEGKIIEMTSIKNPKYENQT